MSYETRYMNDVEFVGYVRSLNNEYKQIIPVDGKNRWLITDENGERYILRPESSRV